MKSVFAVLLVCFVVCSIINRVHGAEPQYCGDDLTWVYENGVLTISGTGKMTEFSVAPPWYKYLSSIESVVINEGATTIGRFAFQRATALTSVSLPSTLWEIGEYAFNRCTQLSSIVFPDSVISLKLRAFSESGLVRVTLPINLELCENYVFERCNNLTEAIIPGSIETIVDDTFSDCRNLTSVTIQEGVKTIGPSAFEGCGSLSTVVFPNSLIEIQTCAFCSTGLTHITIPKNVSSLYYQPFGDCKSLISISVEEGSSHFASSDGVLYDSEFKTLHKFPPQITGAFTVPSTVTTIEGYAFEFCKLTDLVISDSVKGIGSMAFANCKLLKNVTLSKNCYRVPQMGFMNCISLTEIVIPKGTGIISDDAFYGCTNLSRVVIPSGLYEIEQGAFHNCDSLTSFELDKESKSFTLIDGVLFNAKRNTLVLYPPGRNGPYTIPDGVVSIKDYAFSGCRYLTDVVFPIGLKSVGKCAFESCSNLTTVILPDGLREIGQLCFYWATGIKTVFIPDSVSVIKSGIFVASKSLETVFYQGSQEVTESLFSSDSYPGLCVSPDYKSTKFGGKSVTSNSPTCSEFRGLFNHCFKPTLTQNGFVMQMRENATEWEKQNDDCAIYKCDNNTGPVMDILHNEEKWKELEQQEDQCIGPICQNEDWVLGKKKNASEWESRTNECVKFECDGEKGGSYQWMCNSRSQTCVDGKCVDEWESKINGWVVNVTFKENVTYDLFKPSEVIDSINLFSESVQNGMKIGVKTNEKGEITHIMFFVVDKDSAHNISSSVYEMKQIPGCDYSVLCFTYSCYIREMKGKGDQSKISHSSELHSSSDLSHTFLSGAQLKHDITMNWVLLMLTVVGVLLEL